MVARSKLAGRKIKVLIVDDSASVRQAMSEIIDADPELEVLATASDPYVAAERIRNAVPDVIFLDIEMPRMDGLTFLRKIMAQRPVPVVICSSMTDEGSAALMQALEGGAVDVVTKPRLGSVEFLKEARARICDTAKAAAHAKMRGPRPKPIAIEAKLTADAVIPFSNRRRAVPDIGTRIVCIGASTGGTEALREVLMGLPANCPPILIVQHMPEKFTAAFARRLDGICAMSVKEAEEGDEVLSGRVLIAPGNRHMLLKRSGLRFHTAIADGPPVCRHRPSVDVLFRSAAQAAAANAIGIIMTGMGDDGARGLLEMRNAGAFTVAQDEESCIVFGMPKEAIQRNAAQKVAPLSRIAHEILYAEQATAKVP